MCVSVCVSGAGVVRGGIIEHFVSHICHIKVVNWLFKALHNPFIHTCSGHMHALVVLSDTPSCGYQRCAHSLARKGFSFHRQREAFAQRWIHLGTCVTVWIMVRFHIKVRARAYT